MNAYRNKDINSICEVVDCSQFFYLRTPKKKRAKRARRTRGWGVGFASEASKKNSEAVDIFGEKSGLIRLLRPLSPCY